MVDISTDWVNFEAEFDKGKVSMQLLPLDAPDMLDLLDLATAGPKDILKHMVPVFKKHVRNIKGITVNGDPLTVEQFATVGRLYALGTTILTELGMISQLSGDERKNLKGLSGLQTSDKIEPSE